MDVSQLVNNLQSAVKNAQDRNTDLELKRKEFEAASTEATRAQSNVTICRQALNKALDEIAPVVGSERVRVNG